MMYWMRSLQDSLYIHLPQLLDMLENLIQVPEELLRFHLADLQSPKLGYIFCVLGISATNAPIYW